MKRSGILYKLKPILIQVIHIAKFVHKLHHLFLTCAIKIQVGFVRHKKSLEMLHLKKWNILLLVLLIVNKIFYFFEWKSWTFSKCPGNSLQFEK